MKLQYYQSTGDRVVSVIEIRACTFSSPDPLVFRLKMSLTSDSGHAKKFEFFHWLTKNECGAEIKITKNYAFHFTSGRHSASEQPRAGERSRAFQKSKYKQTRRRRRRKNISFPVFSASPAMISFMTETILFCCLVAAEQLKF